MGKSLYEIDPEKEFEKEIYKDVDEKVDLEDKKRKAYITKQKQYKEEILKENIDVILHPAGGFDKKTGLVYEPVGNMRYIFKLRGWKGIGKAKWLSKYECPSCGMIISTNNEEEFREAKKCSCGRKRDFKVLLQEIRLEEDMTGLDKNSDEDIIDLRIISENLNLKFEKDKKPLKKIIFKVPSDESILYWLNNDLPIDNNYIFNMLKNYFKVFYDLPVERSYDIMAIGAIQSWLIEILDVLFYISISGETGSGKTCLLEFMDICRHGLMTSSIKSAGIARCAEIFKLSLGLDEIDNKKAQDDDLEGICRQGYRRGQYYIRMKPMTHEPEFFDVFGFKSFTYRSSVSDDLQNRSIDIPLKRTKNQEVPIINMFRGYFSPYELMQFWYLDNVSRIYSLSPGFSLSFLNKNIINSINEINDININKDIPILHNDENISNNDKSSYNNEKTSTNLNNLNNIINININNNIVKVRGLIGDPKNQRNAIVMEIPYLVNFIKSVKEKPIYGRNIEISYLIYCLAHILELDIDEIMMETIEQKQEIEEASSDEGWSGLLMDVLRDNFQKSEIKEGIRIIPYKRVIGKYLQRMREMYDNIPSQQMIRKLLRQVGFIDGINRKVMWVSSTNKAMLCFIYDSSIREKLGIIEDQATLNVVDKKFPQEANTVPPIQKEFLVEEEKIGSITT